MKFSISTQKDEKNGFTRVIFSEECVAPRFIERKDSLVLEMKKPKESEMNSRKFLLLVRSIVSVAKQHRLGSILVYWDDLRFPFVQKNDREFAFHFAVNALMADYQFVHYKEKPKEGWPFLNEIRIVVGNQLKNDITLGIKRGEILGLEVNTCRDLANMPGGDMTPEILARSAGTAIKGTGITLRVLDKAEMKKLGMFALLGVAKGSKENPCFLILEYKGTKSKNPIVLVGKGVTFDTGGLDIKPYPHALDMNMDMSGGAAVIHSIIAVAKMGIKKHVIGLVPAVENMPSGESYRPGDVLRTMSGKTIEVLNTDAEGRIILADALCYAKRYKPGLVVDVATLTGAAMVALGQRASALYCQDETLIRDMQNYAEQSGDYMWPMPLWEEYEADIRGNVGDVANMATKGSERYGGSITAAAFLWQFAKDFPQWVHIDMAPRMTAVHDEYLAKGAAGAPVQFLVQLIEKWNDSKTSS